ncbi:hypothetical protein ACLMJK_006562 [Lecanora helva]
MAGDRSAQLGAWIDNPGPDASIRIHNDIPIPEPGLYEVLIKISCSGVCHSDVHNMLGYTPMSTDIGGHEGVGHVIKLGASVPEAFLNKRVGVKWLHTYCNECEICKVDVTNCPNQHNSGRDMPGTFQQYTISPIEGLTMIPQSLADEVAAPLLCAGLTMYGSIVRSGLQAGEWLVLTGAGGGLGHLGVQIAREKGLKVIAIDTGQKKKELCMRLGATAFLDFKHDNVENGVKKLTRGYGAHGVICTAGLATYAQAPRLVRNCGTIVCVGLVTDNLPVSPFELLNRGLKIVGSAVGTPKHLDELLGLAVQGTVKPLVEVRELGELDEVMKSLASYQVEGRIVVRIP